MNEHAEQKKAEKGSSANLALLLSILLFATIYLIGIARGLSDLTQRQATD